MASSGTYTTPEGIVRKLPLYWVKKDRSASAGKLNTLGAYEKIELELDMTTLTAGGVNYNTDRNNDGTLDGFSANDPLIPANSSIVSCAVFVSEAVTGGTSFDIGTFLADGTAVDADGFDAAIITAAVNAVGKRVDCNGALSTVAGASVGTSDVVVGISAVGTFTAGRISIVVEYTLNQ